VAKVRAEKENKAEKDARLEFLLAQISLRVYLLNHSVVHLLSSKAPDPKAKLEDFYPKRVEKKPRRIIRDQPWQEQKSIWCAVVGLKLEN
jgi:hypothetical protein